MAEMLRNFARWLAWQIGDLERPVLEEPASITVISTAGLTPGSRGA